jgi:N utilization substance protein B
VLKRNNCLATCLELIQSSDAAANTQVTQDNHEKRFSELTQREKRSLIFHLLYAAESFNYQSSLNAIIDNFNRGFNLDIPFDDEAVITAQTIIDQREQLDETFKPYLSNWRFDRLGVCTKLILRYALWELHNTDTQTNIIINEAIELAKCFAEKDAYKFINGILDKAVSEIKTRTPEE